MDAQALAQPQNGLSAEYFNNLDFTGCAAQGRVEGPLDFRWRTDLVSDPNAEDELPSGVEPTTFSARWDGWIMVPVTGNYEFQTLSDDGARVYISRNDDTIDDLDRIINDWNQQLGHPPTLFNSEPYFLEATRAYPIRVEYFQLQFGSRLQLNWRVSTADPFIPVSHTALFTSRPTPPTATPSPTWTPTSTPTPTPPGYGIRFSNDLGQAASSWSAAELNAIQTAVQIVGQAFQIQMGASSPENAFNLVMVAGADPQYVYFFRADGSSSSVTIVYPPELNKPNHTVAVNVGGCLTVNNNGLPRTIVCNWSSNSYAVYPTHAIVHELGHVFTNRSILANSTDINERTRGLLYAAIEGTYSGNCTPAFDANNSPNPFSGMVFASSSCSSVNDLTGSIGLVMGRNEEQVWRRGERGWGSGPDNIFTPFQQHPSDVFPNDPPDTQVDETAADMFLNWIYRRRTNSPTTYQTAVPGAWEGFSNREWRNNGSGSDDFNYPGDARFEWMNRVMSQIFSLKGW